MTSGMWTWSSSKWKRNDLELYSLPRSWVAQCSYKIFGQMSACPRAIYSRSLLFLKFVDSAAELQSCTQPTRNTENSVDHQSKHTVISNLSFD